MEEEVEKEEEEEEEEGETVLPEGWTLVLSSAGDPYYFNEVTGESQWTLPVGPCEAVSGLTWTRNSCYIDSPLQALFTVPSPLGNYILDTQLHMRQDQTCGDDAESDLEVREEVQEELGAITEIIRGEVQDDYEEFTADGLREILSQCASIENWNNSRMRDAGEFLQFLFNLFPNMNHGRDVVTTVAYNDTYPDGLETSVVVNHNTSPILLVDTDVLIESEPGVLLSSFVEIARDSGILPYADTFRPIDDQDVLIGEFNRRVSTTTVEQVPGALIFYVQRGQAAAQDIADAVEDFSTHPVSLDETFMIGDQTLSVSAVVVFHGAHYTCYFLCDSSWYLYDDTEEDKPVEIGGFEDLLEHNDGAATTHGVMYFYNVTSGPIHLPGEDEIAERPAKSSSMMGAGGGFGRAAEEKTCRAALLRDKDATLARITYLQESKTARDALAEGLEFSQLNIPYYNQNGEMDPVTGRENPLQPLDDSILACCYLIGIDTWTFNPKQHEVTLSYQTSPDGPIREIPALPFQNGLEVTGYIKTKWEPLFGGDLTTQGETWAGFWGWFWNWHQSIPGLTEILMKSLGAGRSSDPRGYEEAAHWRDFYNDMVFSLTLQILKSSLEDSPEVALQPQLTPEIELSPYKQIEEILGNPKNFKADHPSLTVESLQRIPELSSQILRAQYGIRMCPANQIMSLLARLDPGLLPLQSLAAPAGGT